MKSFKTVLLQMITFLYGDIFDSPNGNSLAHCISKDAKMSKGIALQFVTNFPLLNMLRQTYMYVGTAEAVPVRGFFIYNLVSKHRYWMKPSLEALKSCLSSMLEHAVLHQVSNISVPQLGGGCDKLDFKADVLPLLITLFENSPVHIHVYFDVASPLLR